MQRASAPPPIDELQRLRPHTPDDFWSPSVEDLGPSSPPYRTVASSSNLNIYSEYPPTPPYASTARLNEMPDKTSDQSPDDADPHPSRIESKRTKPTVHYVEELNTSPRVGPAPRYTRTDSAQDISSSRASSINGTDEDDSDNYYDWSGDEDLVDEEAKFEERMGVKPKPEGWGFKRIMTMLFSTLIGSTFLAGVLITPALIVQFYWYKPHPTSERAYIKDNIQAWLFWAASNLVISWYLAMIIDIIPILARFFISISWGHVSEYVKTRIEMYDSLKDTIKPLFYASSGWASWTIIFGQIYDLFNTDEPNKSRAPYTQRLAQVIEFGFFFALVICVKRLLSHAIAFSFHKTAYKDRIELVQEALTAIEKLRQYRPKIASRNINKSGLRTPVLSSLGFTSPFSEKDHFNSLSGALRAATPPGTRIRGRKLYDHDDGEDGDVEDGDRTATGGSREGSPGWKGKGKGKKADRTSWIHYNKSPKLGSDGTVEEEFEMSARTDGSRPTSLLVEGGSPLRYPPTPRTGSPRPSVSSEGGDTLLNAAKVIKNAVLHDARNIRGTEEGLASIAWSVGSTHEAKRLARSIYTRFKDRRRTYLLPSDFYPAFSDVAEAEAAFRVFDKDNNGDISRGEIKATLVKVYKERRFLSRSMRDVGAALKTLDQIILFFAMVILFFISLSVFGVNVGDSLTSVYSIGIAASFIFKNAASSAFDAIMFLFVTHPYDTGDRCVIDQEVLVVKKVGLFATVFARADGTETYYFNSQLFTKFITNVRRSGKTSENLTMQVAWRTPIEKLDALEKCLNDWLSTEENRWFEPSTTITLQRIEFQRYLELTIGIGHNGYETFDSLGLSASLTRLISWQKLADWGLRWARKTAFHAAVQHYCRELGITCIQSPIPVAYTNPASDSSQSPLPVSPEPERESGTPITEQQPMEEGEEEAAKEIKPVLGFLPPSASRASNLTRARKSKSKKTMLRNIDS